MARIPLVTRDQIAENEKPAYDAFMASRAGRPNIGPYSLLLHMPEMAQRLEALRLCLRDEPSLSQKLQELVMISVAREMGCAFIWYAHAAAARTAGVRDDIVDAIRERCPLASRRRLHARASPESEGERPDVRRRHCALRSAGDHGADQSDRLLRRAGVQHERVRARGAGARDRKTLAGLEVSR